MQSGSNHPLFNRVRSQSAACVLKLFPCGFQSVPELHWGPGNEAAGNDSERPAQTALFKVLYIALLPTRGHS